MTLVVNEDRTTIVYEDGCAVNSHCVMSLHNPYHALHDSSMIGRLMTWTSASTRAERHIWA